MPMARAMRVFEARTPRLGSPKRSGGVTIFDFHPGMLHGAPVMASEEDRTRLIGEIARLLRDDAPPDDARAAALTLIGWLARRMPGEIAHAAGVPEMLKRTAARSQSQSRGAGALAAPVAGRALRTRRLR
jgi:hypothetical protein